jgi:hypothetical protein
MGFPSLRLGGSLLGSIGPGDAWSVKLVSDLYACRVRLILNEYISSQSGPVAQQSLAKDQGLNKPSVLFHTSACPTPWNVKASLTGDVLTWRG